MEICLEWKSQRHGEQEANNYKRRARQPGSKQDALSASRRLKAHLNIKIQDQNQDFFRDQDNKGAPNTLSTSETRSDMTWVREY